MIRIDLCFIIYIYEFYLEKVKKESFIWIPVIYFSSMGKLYMQIAIYKFDLMFWDHVLFEKRLRDIGSEFGDIKDVVLFLTTPEWCVCFCE